MIEIFLLIFGELVKRAVAQLVARTLGVREVVSSNLAGPTILYTLIRETPWG